MSTDDREGTMNINNLILRVNLSHLKVLFSKSVLLFQDYSWTSEVFLFAWQPLKACKLQTLRALKEMNFHNFSHQNFLEVL